MQSFEQLQAEPFKENNVSIKLTQILVFSPLQAESQNTQLQTECLVSVTWRCDTLVNNHTVCEPMRL